jgi:hypothetical protein
MLMKTCRMTKKNSGQKLFDLETPVTLPIGVWWNLCALVVL